MSKYHEILERAREIDKTLLATDLRFSGSVSVLHYDGSTFLFNRAFAVKSEHMVPGGDDANLPEIKQKFYVVFTEHHGVHVWDADDLLRLTAYSRGGALESLSEFT